jgi:hypothetical protein
MMLPTDTEKWNSAVLATYRLRQRSVAGVGYRVDLFGLARRSAASSFTTAPYGGEGGAWFRDGTAPEPCVAELRELLRETGARYLLVRSREHAFERYGDAFVTDRSYFSFTFDLRGGPDAVWNRNLNTKVRNQVRKGQKSAPEIRVGGAELLQDAFEVIARCWRDLGTPTHGIQFYREVLRAFGDEASLIVVYLGSRPVSTALVIHTDGCISDLVACTRMDYRATSVNNVLYWRIIEFGCERKAHSFDMGRSRVGQGTYSYKVSWGGKPVQLYYSYLLAPGQRPPDYDGRLYRLATAAWKHVPVPVANLLGPRLICNIL